MACAEWTSVDAIRPGAGGGPVPAVGGGRDASAAVPDRRCAVAGPGVREGVRIRGPPSVSRGPSPSCSQPASRSRSSEDRASSWSVVFGTVAPRELLASVVRGPLDERVRDGIIAEARGNLSRCWSCRAAWRRRSSQVDSGYASRFALVLVIVVAGIVPPAPTAAILAAPYLLIRHHRRHQARHASSSARPRSLSRSNRGEWPHDHALPPIRGRRARTRDHCVRIAPYLPGARHVGVSFPQGRGARHGQASPSARSSARRGHRPPPAAGARAVERLARRTSRPVTIDSSPPAWTGRSRCPRPRPGGGEQQ